MKNFRILIFAISVQLLSFQLATACDYNIPSIRKQFRDSKNVFIGQIIEISDAPKNLQNIKQRRIGGQVKFKVEKSWKGNKDKEIFLLSDLILMPCDGNPFESFEKGESYLIFSESDYVYYIYSTKLKFADDKVKKLNSFSFRFWSRINPF